MKLNDKHLIRSNDRISLKIDNDTITYNQNTKKITTDINKFITTNGDVYLDINNKMKINISNYLVDNIGAIVMDTNNKLAVHITDQQALEVYLVTNTNKLQIKFKY